MEVRALARVTRAEAGGPAGVERLKAALTLDQKGGERFGFGPGQRVALYREVADWIEVPRQWALREVGAARVEDRTAEGEPAPFRFTGALRPAQAPLVEEFLARLAEPANRHGGVFSAACGSGKTVMAAAMLARLGRKACVLVHAGFLVKQWRDTFLGLTDLRPEDVGIVQQDKCEWEGKKVVLAMVESLVGEREYPRAMFDSFGVLVLDEVHRHGAAEWGRAATLFPARVRLGLSATPRRGDGLWDVIRWHVGEVLVQAEGGGTATVYQVPTGVEVPRDVYEGRGAAELNLARLVNALTRTGRRNDLIVAEIVRAMRAGRRALVLSDRLEHLDTLAAMYDMVRDADGPAETGRYVGGAKDADIERNRGLRLLFGTYQYAKEGLDDPTLDTLFLATPRGDVEQAVGRILRDAPGKRPPLVVDFVDERTGPCAGFAKRRRRQCEDLGFEVRGATPARA